VIFSSYSFILIFLPITFLGYRLFNAFKLYDVAKLWLVFASLYFYAQGSASFVWIFIADVLFNLTVGAQLIQAHKANAVWNKRILLAVGLAANILFLGYYKYYNFAIENINFLTGQTYALLQIALPLGISFFTFQFIAYLVDCYRGKALETSIIDFLLFVTFFPQLIVGPIVHQTDVVPQFNDKKQPLFNKTNMMLGMVLFSIGCAKKILLADPLTGYAVAYFNDTASGDTLTAWLSSFSYTLSYYFDLSGYADMAIGLGLFFNIKLPSNFNSPYKARNFREYWQRWHMTLSRFLSDYIFRSVYRKGKGSFNFYFAVMVTFLVSGFWHGAGWQFVLWGILNGVFVCMSHFMYRNNLKLPFIIAWVITFAGVVGTRILFVSDSMKESLQVFRTMFSAKDFANMDMSLVLNHVATFAAYHLYVIALLIVAMLISFFGRSTTQLMNEYKPKYWHAAAAAVLFGISLSQMTSVSNFLYFQF